MSILFKDLSQMDQKEIHLFQKYLSTVEACLMPACAANGCITDADLITAQEDAYDQVYINPRPIAGELLVYEDN